MNISSISRFALASFLLTICVDGASAACSWTTLTNGTTANATQVMNNLDCLAPSASPRFSGTVGINTPLPNNTVGLDISGGIYSQATKSNTVSSGSPSATGVITGPDAYWTLRSDTSNRFHLDVYNGGGGNQLAALSVSQNGTVGIRNAAPNATVGLDVAGGIYSQATESNTVSSGSPNATGVLTGPGAYWTLRSDASHRFNLDVYNGGSGGQLAAITVAQNGYTGIGRSSPAQKLDVNGTIRQSNCTTAGTLAVNGSGDIICSSDRRLKNLRGRYWGGLRVIAGITPQRFVFRSGASSTVERFEHVGFIAQDVKQAIPQAVALQRDGYYSLETTAILAAAVNAIKELEEQNRVQAIRMSQMQARNADLQSRLYRLERSVPFQMAKR